MSAPANETLVAFMARNAVTLVTAEEFCHDSGSEYWQASAVGDDLPIRPGASSGCLLAKGITRAEALANLEAAIIAHRAAVQVAA